MNARPWVMLRWAEPDAANVAHPLLDAAERARCAHLRMLPDRARHATARVLAKRAAADAHGVPADRVGIEADTGPTAGRPHFVIDGVDAPAHLSISHAGDVVVVALADVACGVDVEQTSPLAGVIDSDLVWSERELALLAAEPEQSRLQLACRWWTGKEAALKAVGRGIVDDLAAVDATGSRVTLDSLGSRHTLDLRHLTAPRGYCASLALVSSSAPAPR